MVNVRFIPSAQSGDRRFSANVSKDTTLNDFLNEHGISANDGALLHLNGGAVSASDLNKSFAQLGFGSGSEVMLAKVVNAKGA